MTSDHILAARIPWSKVAPPTKKVLQEAGFTSKPWSGAALKKAKMESMGRQAAKLDPLQQKTWLRTCGALGLTPPQLPEPWTTDQQRVDIPWRRARTPA